MRLKDWRISEGLSQQAAADRCGVTRTAWANYESAARMVPQGVLDITGCEQHPQLDTSPRAAPAWKEEAPPAPIVERADDTPAPQPRAKVKARTGDVAAPVKIVGQTARGLNIGADGCIYGHFRRVSEDPKLAKVLAGTGARWTEDFPSANGYGAGKCIVWGILRGEAETDCAPVLAGRHYTPWRANVNRTGGDPLPKKAA